MDVGAVQHALAQLFDVVTVHAFRVRHGFGHQQGHANLDTVTVRTEGEIQGEGEWVGEGEAQRCVCVCGRGKGLVEGACVWARERPRGSTWSTRRLGSGEMTVRPEKSTRLPLRLPRNRPCLPLSRWHKPRTACGVRWVT